MFFVGPAIIFALDKVVSLQTKFVELDILETELLPSGKCTKEGTKSLFKD